MLDAGGELVSPSSWEIEDPDRIGSDAFTPVLVAVKLTVEESVETWGLLSVKDDADYSQTNHTRLSLDNRITQQSNHGGHQCQLSRQDISICSAPCTNMCLSGT